MYKRDKVVMTVIFIFLFIICFTFKIDMLGVIDSIITILSILIGFYMTAIATMYGKRFIRDMSKRQDKRLRNKTELKVMINYFYTSIIFNIVTILMSLIVKIINIYTNDIMNFIVIIVSSCVAGFLIISIYLMFRLLKLFMNGLYTEAKL